MAGFERRFNNESKTQELYDWLKTSDSQETDEFVDYTMVKSVVGLESVNYMKHVRETVVVISGILEDDTGLIKAVKSQSLERVQQYLREEEASCRIHETDSNGYSVMRYSALLGDYDIFKELWDFSLTTPDCDERINSEERTSSDVCCEGRVEMFLVHTENWRSLD